MVFGATHCFFSIFVNKREETKNVGRYIRKHTFDLTRGASSKFEMVCEKRAGIDMDDEVKDKEVGAEESDVRDVESIQDHRAGRRS